MKVAVISDTHDLIRPEIVDVMKNCDAIIHAGDIASEATLKDFEREAGEKPLYFVRGNADRSFSREIPETLEITLSGKRVFVVHKKKDIPKNIEVDIVITGHTHKFSESRLEGVLWLNPGSCGPRRFDQKITMAVLQINDVGDIIVDKVIIPNNVKKAIIPADRDLLSVIEKIMKRMDRGESVDAISSGFGLDREFVENICRIRLTHPGVSANGILDKMEVNRIVEGKL